MTLDGRFDPPIRPATDADGPAVGALMAAVFTEYPGCLYDAAEYPELTALATHYRSRAGRFWIAEDDMGLAGCIGVDRPAEPGQVELHRLYVARRARRRGLAGRLFALALAEARQGGAPEIVLWSDTRFRDAHRFYERRGFVQIGTRTLDDISHSVEFGYRLTL